MPELLHMIHRNVLHGGSAETIGARLKRLRLQSGFSQRDLSSPGVSYAYISRIEAGARTPSVKALRKLSQKLGVSVEYLETGRDIRDVDDRELRLADAELELRLARNTAEAEKKLTEVFDEAAQAGDVVSATRAQLALGLVSAQRGNHLDAVERLEAVLEGGGVSVDSRPDVYATLGQSYAFLGAPERSVRLFRRCLEELGEGPEHATSRIWFATLLSYALTDSGDYDGARDVIRGALEGGGIDTDPYSRMRLYWSRARLAGIEGRSAEALDSMREAIALLKATDDSLQLARAYLMSAGIEANEGNADVAERQLGEAERLLGESSEPVDRAMSLIGRSRVAALKRDGARAVANARAAMDLLGSTHAGGQGAAVWAFARGLALQGEVDSSIDAYHRAVDLLSVHGQRHDAGLAAVELAALLRNEGRADEADTILRRAYDLGVDAETASARPR
jgi:transcriptional regulator with XRE-family HTH domain